MSSLLFSHLPITMTTSWLPLSLTLQIFLSLPPHHLSLSLSYIAPLYLHLPSPVSPTLPFSLCLTFLPLMSVWLKEFFLPECCLCWAFICAPVFHCSSAPCWLPFAISMYWHFLLVSSKILHIRKKKKKLVEHICPALHPHYNCWSKIIQNAITGRAFISVYHQTLWTWRKTGRSEGKYSPSTLSGSVAPITSVIIIIRKPSLLSN